MRGFLALEENNSWENILARLAAGNGVAAHFGRCCLHHVNFYDQLYCEVNLSKIFFAQLSMFTNSKLVAGEAMLCCFSSFNQAL